MQARRGRAAVPSQRRWADARAPSSRQQTPNGAAAPAGRAAAASQPRTRRGVERKIEARRGRAAVPSQWKRAGACAPCSGSRPRRCRRSRRESSGRHTPAHSKRCGDKLIQARRGRAAVPGRQRGRGARAPGREHQTTKMPPLSPGEQWTPSPRILGEVRGKMINARRGRAAVPS